MPDSSTEQLDLIPEATPPKRLRSPLERTFSDLKGIEFDIKRLISRFEDWKDETTHPQALGNLQDCVLDFKECLTRFYDVSEACIRLRNIGFRGEDDK